MAGTLLRANHPLALPEAQRKFLESGSVPAFDSVLLKQGAGVLTSSGIDILQMNVGRVCNQTCAHCHVDAGPDRRESMSRGTFEHCLRVLEEGNIPVVDITGGAPELNENFRWFVESASGLGKKVMVRCNLTIILSNERFMDLPEFFARHRVQVISSLPHYSETRTDAQRGAGVFERSMKALKLLNDAGYGREDSGLELHLVYNPVGAFLPGSQSELEDQFKFQLLSRYAITFNHLYCITNMPISRYLEYLVRSGNYEAYMNRLVSAFNPAAVPGLMCKNTLSVGWDGRIFDCDFNQMLDLEAKPSSHISSLDLAALRRREIVTGRHCYGCTAGAGSSCGGQTA